MVDLPYTVRLPDGGEYGPTDLATLLVWHRDGRLPEGSVVQTEGRPDWQPVPDLIRDASAAAAAEPTLSSPVPVPVPARRAAPRRAPRAEGTPTPSKVPRALLLLAAGLLLVVVLLGGLFALLSPWIARRRAIAEIQRQALPDRRFADRALGITVDLPQGWLILRPDTRLVPPSDAKLALAQPGASILATLRVEAQPRLVAGEDICLDQRVEIWRVYRPGLEVRERGDLRLAKGQGRVLQTSWMEGGEPTVGTALAFHDGWNYFILDAWAPAANRQELTEEFQTLARSVAPAGDLEGRVEEAVRRVAVEAPELSRTGVRLLVQARMSTGSSTEDLAETSLRIVNRGLNSLSIPETEEVGQIYEQVWGPLPEAERRRLARYLDDVKAGRPVAPEEGQPLRQLVKAGILSLPEETQARLQALNEKAIVAGLGRP